MISTEELLNILKTDEKKVYKLGKIDPNYASGDPRILFDGETKVSVKKYKTINYSPIAGDRVLLVNLAGTHLVLGKIGSAGGTYDDTDIATQIANRIKKDGDTINGIYINNKLVDGIYLRTGATTDGIIIKTNVPDIAFGVQFLEVTGFGTNIFKIYIKIRKATSGDLSFLSPIAYSINTFKPEIKVFFLDGKICIRLDTNISYVDLKISMINSSVLTLSQVQGWSVSNGAVPVGAVGTTIVPYMT